MRRTTVKWLIELGNLIECLFENHKFVRRSSVYWAWALITYATITLFSKPSEINGAAAAAFSTVCALLTAVIGLYQWDRTREDKLNDVDDDN